jgi:hypothetical protein
MPAGGDLLKPPETYRMPADPVGKRPQGESPRTTPVLLWMTLLDTWYHFGKICIITLYAGAMWSGYALLVGCSMGHVLKGQSDWTRDLASPLYWPLLLPIGTGYVYALLLVVQHKRPKAREVLRAFEGRALYFNVLLASAVPALGAWALGFIARLIAADLPEIHPTEDPVTNRFLAALPYTLISLLFLPFAFAGIDAIAARTPWTAAIRRSLAFVIRSPRLFAGFVITSAFLHLVSAAATAAQPVAKEQPQLRSEVLSVMASWMIPLGLSMFSVLLMAFVAVQFYREFVWREREAAAPSPA